MREHIDRVLLDRLRPTIISRLAEFQRLHHSRWIREVAFCLLTPQSSPFNAEQAMLKLEDMGLFDGKLRQSQIAQVLRSQNHYIRFHITKAERLLRFVENSKNIYRLLKKGEPPEVERLNLVSEVKGIGFKEASHALRNIGRRNLAILDRHILRKLVRLGIIGCMPKALSPSAYLEIENKFRSFGRRIGESIDVLDFLFWFEPTGLIFK